mmetsp:Transcript_17451/g.26891  ORF Transcript_17451/g.26891 Transcript_17451/m.26891 type:complete len:91 (+) Transcript_17451:1418-1690(+)
MIIFLLALYVQEKINQITVEEFKDELLSMSDFTIEVTGLPPVKEYKNEHILKALLWQHFDSILRVTPQQIKRMEHDQKYEKEIVDIFFGY